ncbi:MAG TPA: 23S rRNA (uracil(1939)-C(5))-methyltransferase RlmD [Nitrososphaeria archaeon]|nr:MAG: 23S rRNA (uracil(1939)-C(5))-methyltransferase RlmD [Nitrososphaera sp.]HEU16173.1 23S rRNA (uracil(1939)-C(5))-methyltransferase RlmD [Nitrososphaeria archaeon]
MPTAKSWERSYKKVIEFARRVSTSTAICPHYGICGGCSIQHLPYEKQLEMKRERIVELIGREPDEVVPSPVIWNYRNRMDYAISRDLAIGLRERGKWWSYVDLKVCPLQSPEADALREDLRRFSSERGIEGYDVRRHTGVLRYLVVREGKFTGERMAAIITTEPIADTLRDFSPSVGVDSLLNGVNGGPSDTSRAERIITVRGKETISEKLAGYKFSMALNSFFQTNPYTAELMVKFVKEEVYGSRTVYDLYSGVGTFTLPAADVAEYAVGVESDPLTVELARRNAADNGSSADFMTAKVEALGTIDADTVILDPPRAGLHPKVVGQLLSSSPAKIIYLSCNPARQAEDLAKLREYTLERLVMVDQFPHTHHVETIAVLSRGAQI